MGAAGAVMVAGCGGRPAGGDGDGDGDGDGVGDGDGDGDGQPDQTVLRLSIEATPSNLDPHTVDITSDIDMLCFPENAYETLVFQRYDGETLEPRLASELPSEDNGLITNDGRTIEFPLREGVQFHSGGEMIADDVVYSWNRVRELGLSGQADSLWARIENVEAADDYRLRVDLDRFHAPFFTSVLTLPAAVVVSEQAVEDNGGIQAGQPNQWMAQNAAAGTGPYFGGHDVAEFVPDDFAVWESFDDYWDPDWPSIDQVRQIAVPEVSTARALYENGELDASADIGAFDLDDMEGTPGVKFEFFPTFDTVDIRFNFDIPYDEANMPSDDTVDSDFFQDRNVRLGFAHTFDFDSFIENVYNGYATRINIYHYPGQLGYDETAPRIEQDFELAEEYFREAGYWDGGFTITAMSEARGDTEGAALIMKDTLQELNPNFELLVNQLPEVQFVERISNQPGHVPMAFGGYLTLGYDPDAYYRDQYHEGGGYASWSRSFEHINPEIPQLIDDAATATDEQDRIDIYHQLQRLCPEDPAAVPIEAEEYMLVSRECVETVDHPAWLRNVPKYWSMENC